MKNVHQLLPDVSIVVISFNTRDLLRDCLRSLEDRTRGIRKQVLVVDNASTDGSADMVKREFPTVELLTSYVNLGFAAANNLAFRLATGRYVVLLNSDAFLEIDAMQRAITHMENEPEVGLGGARLIGQDGCWQPSARAFPSLLNDFFILSGLSHRYPKSKLFGRCDRTWADPNVAADVDWVPGAFSIVRRDVLESAGYFDERFFLYYEEVDLCRTLRKLGHVVRYWPDVVVVHRGGESSKTVKTHTFALAGSQLHLWRMRSAFLYYRKHKGSYVWFVKQMEFLFQWLRQKKNRMAGGCTAKRKESLLLQRLLNQAWQETTGGRTSPARPW